jgi:hypothetical protein
MVNFAEVINSLKDWELELIGAIVERYVEIIKPEREKTAILMDVMLTHYTIGLKLEEMVNGPQYDFVHDMMGIQKHLDRQTGAMLDCFLPRFAVPETDSI